jgi:guanylate kinase
MSNQTLKIIEGLHPIYTGSNGHKTYAITVESTTRTPQESYDMGYQHHFQINDISILNIDKNTFIENLGLNEEFYNSLIKEIKELA